eukprot:COSAG06_NODE_8072_length_2281_cov_3.615490_1_plen_101_part_00
MAQRPSVVKPRTNRQPSVARPSVVEPRKVGLRAITTGSDAIDQVLTESYKPGISQREFVGVALSKDSSIHVGPSIFPTAPTSRRTCHDSMLVSSTFWYLR